MPSIRPELKYSQVPHDLLTSGVSAGAIKTYAVIRMKAWDYGKRYLRGVESLAEEVGVSRQSVSAYLDELEAIGAIERLKRPFGRANAPLLVTHPKTYDPDGLARLKGATSSATLTKSGRSVVKAPAADVTSYDKTSVKGAGRQSSSAGDDTNEEDSSKKARAESTSSFLEEEEVEADWHLEGLAIVVADELDGSDDERSMFMVAKAAVADGRLDELLAFLTQLQAEAPRLKDAARLVTEWRLTDIGF